MTTEHHHPHHYQPPREPHPSAGAGFVPGDYLSDEEIERRFGQTEDHRTANQGAPHPTSHPRPTAANIGPDIGPEDFEGYGGRTTCGAHQGAPHPTPHPMPAAADIGPDIGPEDFEGYGGRTTSGAVQPHQYTPAPQYPQQQVGHGEQGYVGSGGTQSGGPGYPHGPHQYSHISKMAAAHDDGTDPEMFEQAAHHLHQSAAHPPPPYQEGDYQAHLAAHAQAYGPAPQPMDAMDADAIGSAAAIEAIKMSAALPQQPARGPQEDKEHRSGGSNPIVDWFSGGHKNAAPHKPAGPTTTGGPSGSPAIPAVAAAAAPSPSLLGGGGSPQDKIVALAIAQAAKLFDKKNGGKPSNPAATQAKLKAMRTAATTALRLINEYRSSGKFSLQPGELQTLLAAAMAIF